MSEMVDQARRSDRSLDRYSRPPSTSASSVSSAAAHAYLTRSALRFLRSSEVQYEHDLQLNEPQDDFAATRRDTDGIIDDKPRDDLARPVPLATTHGAMSTPTATSHGVRAV